MKILLVLEKPGYKEPMVNCMKKLQFNNEFDFAYKKPVLRINDNSMKLFHIGENKEIMYMNKILDAEWLTLKKAHIPKEIFFEINDADFYKTDIDFSKYDMIIGCPDPDSAGIFGFQKFLEDCNIQNAKFKKVLCYSEEECKKLLSLEGLKDFDEIFNTTYEKEKLKNFESDYPVKYDIKTLRKRTGWTRTKFAQYFKIPYKTVENWESYVNFCSSYLYNLMEYKLKNEGIIS